MYRNQYYKASSYFGMAAFSQDAAHVNSQKIMEAWSDGLTIALEPGTEYFTEGVLMSDRTIGGGIICETTTGPQVSSIDSGLKDKLNFPRVTRIDSDKGGPVISVAGGAWQARGIEVRGRYYGLDQHSNGAAETNPLPKADAGIEFQSQVTQPLSMNHRVSNCTISECKNAFDIGQRYYNFDTKQWISGNESNNDNMVFDNIFISGCDVGANVFNQQACALFFYNMKVFGWGGSLGKNDFIMFNVLRGGDIWCNGLSTGQQRMTVFNICRHGENDYNINAPFLSCHGLRYDHTPDDDYYLTLFRNSGMTWNGMQDTHYYVDIVGTMNNLHVTPYPDLSKLLRIPAAAVGFPLTDIRVKLRCQLHGGMPTGWTHDGGGYYIPTSALQYS